jgi:hypothetical protein
MKKNKPYISFDIDTGKVITIGRFTLLFGWRKKKNNQINNRDEISVRRKVL